MAQWYLSYEGQQSGPYDLAQAQAQAQANPNGYVWREGFAEWLPIGQVGELTQTATPAMTPPPPAMRSADEIDYKIIGHEMQFVEVELDPGESAVAEAGSMMYKNPSVEMEAVFGDGSCGFQRRRVHEQTHGRW